MVGRRVQCLVSRIGFAQRDGVKGVRSVAITCLATEPCAGRQKNDWWDDYHLPR